LKDGACTYFNPGNQRPGDGAAYPRDLYAAFISTLDDKIGLLLKKVSDLGLTEKTIIIFQSDNGYSTEERAHFGGGSAGIYRGAKACLFEGGIRVPAIISWPGKIQKGEVRDQFAVNTDRFPTLAELCGIQQNTDNLNAKSLVPVIQNANAETAHADGYCWAFKNMWVARKGKWKLLGNPQDTSQPDAVFTEKLFLVNLEDDPGETTNLAEKFPEKMKELESPYRQWLANSNQNLIS
jgi:arylsulfatase A-like enzyme